MRKRREKILPKHLLKRFTKRKNRANICAVHMYQEMENENGSYQIIFEYLNYQELESFLDKEDKPKNSILQRFIEPNNNYNNMIKIQWTSSICLC